MTRKKLTSLNVFKDDYLKCFEYSRHAKYKTAMVTFISTETQDYHTIIMINSSRFLPQLFPELKPT